MSENAPNEQQLEVSRDIAQRHTTTSKLYAWACSILGLVCIILAFWLVIKGATGEFKIGLEGKGMKAYLGSMAPGLLFLLSGVIIVWVGVKRRFRYVIPVGKGGDIKVESGIF